MSDFSNPLSEQQIGDTVDSSTDLTFIGGFNLSNGGSQINLKDISSKQPIPGGITFNNDGSKVYITGTNNGVHSFDCSRPFDISTATFNKFFSVSENPKGLAFNSDGSKLYTMQDISAPSFISYDLTTPFDIGTATRLNTFDATGQNGFLKGITFSSNGDTLLTADNNNNNVFQFKLSTAFDITTTSFDTSFDISPQTTSPNGITFNNRGDKMFVISNGAEKVFSYKLTQGFDINGTVTFQTAFDFSGTRPDPNGVDFNDDGTKLYVIGNKQGAIRSFSIGNVGPK